MLMMINEFLLIQQEPLNVVSGVKSFNSGKPVKNNSFLYTFDELGNFTVASQGAPGYACTVHVISTGKTQSMVKSTFNYLFYVVLNQVPIRDKIVAGVRGFRSGILERNREFLHTFDEIGQYFIMSEGVPDEICTIFVVDGKISVDQAILGAF